MSEAVFSVSTLALIVVSVVIYIRFVPVDIESYHKDPSLMKHIGEHNYSKYVDEDALIFDVSSKNLFDRIDTFVLSEPRIKRLKKTQGDHEALITYEQRSRFIGFPDYITFKITSVGTDQSRLEILSRSHYGVSDFGVNQRRIQNWIAGITRGG